MTARRILYIDANRLTATHWTSGHVTVEAEFQPDAVGLEAFGEYLKRYHSSLFYVLADVSEEGFHLEDIPYVTGADRGALLKRRLGQYYYGTQFSVAISLGRASEGRRDEKILFAALTRPEHLTPWLDAIRGAEVALTGVYSIPLALAKSGPRIVGNSDQCLLVTVTRSGVRQTFFDHGKLYFSRLSQMATHSQEETSLACAAEAGKIFQYLLAQRQITRGTPLRTVVLAHPDHIPALREYCRDQPDLTFEFADIAAIGKREGLKAQATDSLAESLLIHRLLTQPPSHQFAPAEERHLYRLWQIRFGLTSAAAVIFAGCLLFGSKTLLQWQDMRAKTQLVTQQAAIDNQRYTMILDGLPKVSITPDNLRAVISRYDDLVKHSPAMEPLLIHLSTALNEQPRIELTRLEWRLSPTLASTPASGGAPAAPTPASATTAGGPWIVLELSAQLPLSLASDMRAQVDLVERFAAQLRKPGYEVGILQLPFDIEPNKPLKSRSERADAAADAPKFSLRLGKRI